jgi:predicted nucleotidyltransferase
LKIDEDLARSLVDELLRQDFIEENYETGKSGYWQTKIKGNALAGANAGRPYKRISAKLVFDDSLKRVESLPDNAYYLYRVKTVVLFGSYLSESPTVNDVDLAVELSPKESNSNHHHELCEQRRQLLWEKGKRYSNYIEYMMWPETEIYNFLKSRSRILSIHRYEEMIWQVSKHEIVYKKRNGSEMKS